MNEEDFSKINIGSRLYWNEKLVTVCFLYLNVFSRSKRIGFVGYEDYDYNEIKSDLRFKKSQISIQETLDSAYALRKAISDFIKTAEDR